MKNKLNKTLKALPSATSSTSSIVVASMALGLLLLSGNAAAASVCKGLDNSACDANASCRWVDAYQRKDNRKVNAFCRTYSGKSNVAKANNVRKKSALVAKKEAKASVLSTKKNIK